ncbi:unnamed protein product (macronuclear) [Paramecium tetraurelia]|uniref:Uncharacterized protein n=1 Tax=Paramecium tetraurelia TaxID=5888 RepID=A0D3L5_PARTE|nr:uncharacterized protein GSPATT00013120001 [Paramecium tetraurelia]CAK77632.1 unnamed protein product [Paramecium tetraurelia]|eukprot:XP_001445029.1 hypothetical protein (macronuclear) [Paramecium tetraurelia strain d4-2]
MLANVEFNMQGKSYFNYHLNQELGKCSQICQLISQEIHNFKY